MSRPKVEWDIRRKGRAWVGDECLERLRILPEKTEIVHGKIFWSEEDRLTVLAVMLEQVGIDEAVRLGDPKLWKAAIKDL